MKKILASLLFAMCGYASATTYYVCDAARGTDAIGNDSNSAAVASNKATPWLTVAKGQAQFSSLAAGDTVAICDGSNFDNVKSTSLMNFSSTAVNPVGFDEYQSTGTLAPLQISYSAATSTTVTTGTALTAGVWNGLRLQVTRGTGMGADLPVISNTASAVTVSSWTLPSGATFIPDATTAMVLRQARPILNCGTWCFIHKSFAPVNDSHGVFWKNLDLRGGGLVGTVTAGTATTATIVETMVPNSKVNCTAAIYQGTGVATNSTMTITANTATQITVANWQNVPPDTTSKIIVQCAVWGILVSNGVKDIVVDNMRMHGFNLPVAFGSATQGTVLGNSDGRVTNATVKNNSFISFQGFVGAGAGDKTLIENNYFDHCSIDLYTHCLYLGGETEPINSVAISSVTGDGTTTTVVTSVPHNIPGPGTAVAISVTGATGGTGSFIASSADVTYVNATTFTYPSSGNGTATGSVYTLLSGRVETNAIVRGNVFSNSSMDNLGTCKATMFVMHGQWNGVLIENNIFQEDVVPTNNKCRGIGLDSGSYSGAHQLEGFKNIVIRGNTVSNFAIGIGVDIAAGVLIENNTVYSAYVGYVDGILMRGKNYASYASGTCDDVPSVLCAKYTQPDNITIKNNTVYLINASMVSRGITLNSNISDLNTGSNYVVTSNVVWMPLTSVATSSCFVYDNMRAAQFSAINYNLCFSGGAVSFATNTASGANGEILNGATLSAFQSSNPTFEVNGSNVDPLIITPVATTVPAFKLTIPTSGGAYNTGAPIGRFGSSMYSIGGTIRSGTGAPSKGAYEPNATLIIPGSVTGIAIH